MARAKGELQIGEHVDAAALAEQVSQLEQAFSMSEVESDRKVLELFGSSGFDALQVRRKTDERYYRRLHRFRDHLGRAVPITCSDAHCVGDVFSAGGALPYLKLKTLEGDLSPGMVFAELRDRALRFGETRVCFGEPGRVLSWIEAVEITPDAASASQTWSRPATGGASGEPFMLCFSPNLNCLIGGRGSGKSSLLEAIAFVLRPDEFDVAQAQPAKDRPDWYRRAEATLSGCNVRVCWRSNGDQGIAKLPRRALFESRYFNPDGKHSGIVTTDADGKEVLSHTAAAPPITLFRIHDIEEAAKPEKLRALLDSICGEEMEALQTRIDGIRAELAEQRNEMLDTAASISNITQAGASLREYRRRAAQFREVDTPEVRTKYAAVDACDQAMQLAAEFSKEWNEIDRKLDVKSTASDVRQLFQTMRDKLALEHVKALETVSALQKLVAEGGPEEAQLISAIDGLEATATQFRSTLLEVAKTIANLRRAALSELEAIGLPTGAKEREVKKLAFEEAVVDLNAYRVFLGCWETLVQLRSALGVRRGQTACRPCAVRSAPARSRPSTSSAGAPIAAAPRNRRSDVEPPFEGYGAGVVRNSLWNSASIVGEKVLPPRSLEILLMQSFQQSALLIPM